jgi:murein L,D-transpeptidase YcbB/YkuD
MLAVSEGSREMPKKSVNVARLLALAAVVLVMSAGMRSVQASDVDATNAGASVAASDGTATAADRAAPPAEAKPADTTPSPAASSASNAPADATPSPAASATSDAPADAMPSPAASAKSGAPAESGTAPAVDAELPAAVPSPAADTEPPAAAPPATEKAALPDAAPPAAAPAAATTEAKPDPDAAIAQQLHNLANGRFDSILTNAQERASVEAFYSGRDYAPLWLTDGHANARAQSAIGYLSHVDADGLNPADYPVPDFATASDPAALVQAEIRLTVSVITYAHHASIGRVHWTRVSGDISYDQKAADPADVLSAVASASDVAQALDAYEPHDPAYLALKAKLAEIRAGRNGKITIADGAAPKLGATDDRVPALRERLGLSGDGAIYDKTLADAVKAFQQQHDLKPTGTLTPATVDALNGHGAGRSADRIADILIANMERWRWMPHDLGKTYVIVNLPDFTLRVIRDGKLDWTTKIVDGKPATPTPIMSAEMKTITVNPTWNVPPSIVANEYLPLLRQDSTILERMGLNVSRNPDGTIHVSQPPGPNNALGQIRFNFPNKFLVYQHDSNQKYLFSNTMRAASHGCMRVEDPAKYAEVLLAIARPGDGYTADRVRRMFGNTENELRFNNPIAVHLTYQTAFVDDSGKLQFRDDIYGRDKDLLAILKSDQQRKVADIPIERKDNAVRRELLAMPDNAFGNGAWGQNFFARMFSNPFAAPFAPQPVPQAAQPGRTRAQRRADAH